MLHFRLQPIAAGIVLSSLLLACNSNDSLVKPTINTLDDDLSQELPLTPERPAQPDWIAVEQTEDGLMPVMENISAEQFNKLFLREGGWHTAYHYLVDENGTVFNHAVSFYYGGPASDILSFATPEGLEQICSGGVPADPTWEEIMYRVHFKWTYDEYLNTLTFSRPRLWPGDSLCHVVYINEDEFAFAFKPHFREDQNVLQYTIYEHVDQDFVEGWNSRVNRVL